MSLIETVHNSLASRARLLRFAALIVSEALRLKPSPHTWLHWLGDESGGKSRRQWLQQLAELAEITVDELMIPRGQVDLLDIARPWYEVTSKLSTQTTPLIAVCRDSLDDLVGVLPMERLAGRSLDGPVDLAILLELLVPANFIPSGSKALTAWQRFVRQPSTMGFVVDEYGDILGLLHKDALSDQLATGMAAAAGVTASENEWGDSHEALVDGAVSLREVNRRYGCQFATDGPKTLNGLILEHLGEIPDSDVTVKIADVVLDIVRCQDRQIKTVRIHRPRES